MLAPEPGLMIWTLITFGVAVLVLTVFAFKPLQKALDARRQFARAPLHHGGPQPRHRELGGQLFCRAARAARLEDTDHDGSHQPELRQEADVLDEQPGGLPGQGWLDHDEREPLARRSAK